MMKNVSKNLETSHFWIITITSFKISNSDSVGVKFSFPENFNPFRPDKFCERKNYEVTVVEIVTVGNKWLNRSKPVFREIEKWNWIFDPLVESDRKYSHRRETKTDKNGPGGNLTPFELYGLTIGAIQRPVTNFTTFQPVKTKIVGILAPVFFFGQIVQ